MASTIRGFSTVAVVMIVVFGGCCGGGHGGVIGLPGKLGICATSVTVYGYSCQEIQVTTEDGYILSVQRIWGGPRDIGGGAKKRPVIMQHGVLVDGITWLLNAPHQNLPMLLADNGYDVWIVNTRGTRFSRRHTSLNDQNPAYWNWTWDQLVVYDLPAVFNHVSVQTGQKIHYVGHSLGTLLVLASLSEGRLVKQLQSTVFLCPVAYLSHMTTALGVLATRTLLDEVVSKVLGIAEFNPKGVAVEKFMKTLCAFPRIKCSDLFSDFTGYNCCLNTSTIQVFLQNEPQSTATKNFIHLAQIARHGVLAKYNYGRIDYNLKYYGKIYPPLYDLANIPRNIPIFISHGGRDALSSVRDVRRLLGDLKYHDAEKITVQFIKDYAHADYIMGHNANNVVYKSVIAFFNKHGY